MSIARRQLLKTLGLAGSAVACSCVAGAMRPVRNTDERKRSNILVFMTDDHAQWLQHPYGNTEVRTPHMSRVAQRGVRLTNAFTTSPVCSPARASFFTGRMPSQRGIHDWIEETKQAFDVPWLQGQTLISELLHEAGYHTGLVEKWHCGSEPRPHPGFDFWYSYWVSQYPHVGTQNFSDNGKHVTVDGRQSPLLTKQAIRFLDQHYEEQLTAQKLWFLFVGYTDTHNPHEDMPPTLVAEYAASTFRDIPSEEIVPVHGKVLNPKRPDLMKEAEQKRQYHAAASAVDIEVGILLDELEKRGILDDTMVIYTSDHGLNAGQHGLWEKGNATIPQNFLEESIRVPCAVSWPNGGIAQPRICSRRQSLRPVCHASRRRRCDARDIQKQADQFSGQVFLLSTAW